MVNLRGSAVNGNSTGWTRMKLAIVGKGVEHVVVHLPGRVVGEIQVPVSVGEEQGFVELLVQDVALRHR